MEKELIINGIKYIRVEEDNFKIGDIVKFNGYDWYIIKIENSNATLLMKNVLSESEVQELFDEEYLDSDNDVCFNKDKANNDWNYSIIRKILNTIFLDEFDEYELNVMRTNYDEDKYSEDHVRLLTIREAERLEDDIRVCGIAYWTMSPSHFNSNDTSAFVWYGYSSGTLYHNWATSAYGVRPVINLSTDLLGS